jgi:hypothetical protein
MLETLLPIEEFRKEISHNPWHFWQLASAKMPKLSNCDPILREYAWQNANSVGRNEIALAIQQAETTLTEYLGYPPGPVYYFTELDTGCLLHNCNRFMVKLDHGYLQKIATRTFTKISTATITITDSDNDGVLDSFSGTFVNTDLTDLTGLVAALASADSLSDNLGEWLIRPVTFKRIDTSTIKISGYMWLLVKPILYRGVSTPPGYDPGIIGLNSSGALAIDTSTNFVTTLDIYNTTYTNDLKATYVYTKNGVDTTVDMNVNVCDFEAGIIKLAPVNNLCTCNLYGPGVSKSRLKINYLAGGSLTQWKTAITRLALANLMRPICNCDTANGQVAYWQQDVALTGTVETQYRVSNRVLDSYLGTKRGQIFAWQEILKYRLLK